MPGLSTIVLVGIDWLSHFNCIIDIGSQNINIGQKKLTDECITFRMPRETKLSCRLIQTCGLWWYDEKFSNYRIGDVIRNIEERVGELEDEVRNVFQSSVGDESCGDQVDSMSGEVFGHEIDDYVAGLNALNDCQREKVKQLLYKYRKVFSYKHGCTNVYKHSIILNRAKAIVRKSYHVALNQRSTVSKEISRLMDLKVLRRSNSQHCNPLRIVLKKTGEVRLCLDARFVNAHQKFEGAKFLSTTHLVIRYWQVPLEKDACQFTAFLHEGHLYEFTRVPFGLKTAGSGFIRTLNLALCQELAEFVSSHVDDILIASKTFKDHLARLYEELISAGFTLGFKKSFFLGTKFCF